VRDAAGGSANVVHLPTQAERIRGANSASLAAKDRLMRDLGGQAGTVEFTDSIISRL
jgi:isocitrate/isopropylmalate dehydrogenase